MSFEETIVAKASAPGSAIRGIVRLSGPASRHGVAFLFRPTIAHSTSRYAVEGTVLPWGPARPVSAKILYWPEGQGYTGQETIEIHTIGAPPILDAIVNLLCQMPTIRLARPGEFTLRAFLAGRLDLTRAEAVLGVIDAKDEKKLHYALDQLAGGLATPLKRSRETLFEILVHLEAGLDFADEDIEFVSMREVRHVLETTQRAVQEMRRQMGVRSLSSERPRVVLTGPPNAGKSSLFNALLNRNQAIVSPIPGTTRDYLEAEVIFDGISCMLIDTAGFDDHTPENEIDATARQQAKSILEHADLILSCYETGSQPSRKPNEQTLLIRTKADRLAPEKDLSDHLAVSAITQQGLGELQQWVAEQLQQTIVDSEVIPNTALRCREGLDAALNSLDRGIQSLTADDIVFDESLLAVEIRFALNHLGLVDGTVHTEDLLDRIFSRFCIGK